MSRRPTEAEVEARFREEVRRTFAGERTEPILLIGKSGFYVSPEPKPSLWPRIKARLFAAKDGGETL